MWNLFENFWAGVGECILIKGTSYELSKGIYRIKYRDFGAPSFPRGAIVNFLYHHLAVWTLK